jgi:hypothetical protein
MYHACAFVQKRRDGLLLTFEIVRIRYAYTHTLPHAGIRITRARLCINDVIAFGLGRNVRTGIIFFTHTLVP